MTAITPIRPTSVAVPAVVEFVVPADTASATFVYDPHVGFGPASFGQFVDQYLTPDLNSMFPGSRIVRWPGKHGARSINACLATSSLVASAPAAAQTLAASLSSALPEAYVVHAVSRGDIWLIASNADALRHACYDVMRRIGCKFYAAHPAWKVVPRTVVDLAVSTVVQPVVRDYWNIGNGGLGTFNAQDSTKAPIFNNASEQWWIFAAQNRTPREFGGGSFGDGDEGFTGYRQCELRHDRVMLAWDVASGERGYGSGGIPNNHFPASCWDYPSATIQVPGKNNYTYHGSSGTYPAAPAGPSPWAGYTMPAAECTTAPNVPCALAVDPNPDSITTPGGYTAFGGLVALHCLFHVQVAFARFATFGEGHPYTRFVSVEPNDGTNHCACTHCIDLLRSGPYAAYLSTAQQTHDSSIADRVFHLANENQKFLNYMQQNAVFANPRNKARCGLFAYHEHAEVPSIPLQPDLLVVVLPNAHNNPQTDDEIIESWITKRTSNPLGQFDLGTQATWLISSTNVDAPKLGPRYTSDRFRHWAQNGFVAYEAQSTYSTMAFGCHTWVHLQQCWDLTVDTDALITEWFANFGPAASAVRACFERWWQADYGVPEFWVGASRFEFSGQEIAYAWQDCQSAQAALDAAPDTIAQQRLDHFRAFVWFQQLAMEYDIAWRAYQQVVNGTTIANLGAASDAFLFCLWCVQPWNIVQSDRHANKVYPRLDASLTTLIAKWNPLVSSGAAGFASVSERTKAQLDAIVAAGAAAYTPIAGVTRRAFNAKLVRLTTSASTSDIRMPTNSTPSTYQFATTGSATFSVEYFATDPTVLLPLRVQWLQLDGTLIQEIDFVPLYNVTTTSSFTLTGQPAGTYMLRVLDFLNNGQQVQLHAQVKQPVTQVGLIACSRGFDNTRLCWFYVPVGETKIYLTYKQAPGAAAIQFYRPDGTTAQATTRHGQSGWYCTVPAGLDGQPWAFTGLGGSEPDGVHFENCPSAIAYDKAQLMVPSGLDGYA